MQEQHKIKFINTILDYRQFQLKLDQSKLSKYPSTKLVAAGIDIVFVVLTNGLENVKTLSLPLKVEKSALDNAPRFTALAVGKLKVCVEVAELIAKSVPLVPT